MFMNSRSDSVKSGLVWSITLSILLSILLLVIAQLANILISFIAGS